MGCKRKDDDPLRGIRIDPDAHKSLASAHGDMSGTNHHHRGINYLIGSVDTNDDWDPNQVQVFANHLMKDEQAKNNLSLVSPSSSSLDCDDYNNTLRSSSNSNSKSETIRLSEISFHINES